MPTKPARPMARLAAGVGALMLAGIAAACGAQPAARATPDASRANTRANTGATAKALGRLIALSPSARPVGSGADAVAVSAEVPRGCGGPAAPQDAMASAILDATNASRGAAGLAPLRWDPELWCLANEWSKVMGDSNDMHHRDLTAAINSPGYAAYVTLGENVLEGPVDVSAGTMHDAWMNSPEHRANILAQGYSSFAVATYVANGQLWATENFGG